MWWMSDVASDILREILIRVPADSLFRLTTVCKAWNQIITDPSFIRSHSQFLRSTNYLLVHSSGDVYSLSLDSLNFATDGLQTIDVTPIETLTHPCMSPPSSGLDMASCNGLILLCNRRNCANLVIWNPLTQEFHELPRPDIASLFPGYVTDGRLCNCGFAYDAAVDDYKVVAIAVLFRVLYCANEAAAQKFLVYSLKSGSWRVSGDCHFDFSFPVSNGVLLNGAIHWSSLGVITALDVATEDYGELPRPPIPIPANRLLFLEDLSVAGGCLILSRYDHEEKRFDGWVMHDYGVEESWMKLFSIEELDILAYARSLRPVVYLKSKRQLVLQCERGLFWFDLENNIVKQVKSHDFYTISSYQFCCLGSLFRLDDGGGGGGGVAKTIEEEEEEEAETRLTFCVRNIGVQPCSDKMCCDSEYSHWALSQEFDDIVYFRATGSFPE